MIIRLPFSPMHQYDPGTKKFQCSTNKLFVTSAEYTHDNGVPLYILIVQNQRQKDVRKLQKYCIHAVLDIWLLQRDDMLWYHNIWT